MRILNIALIATTLSGCGIVYHSTSVTPGISDLGKVRVLPLTAESVMAANADPYQPRELPAYFFQTAGLSGTSVSPIAPPATAFDRISRPAGLQTILPPAVPAGTYRIGAGDVVLLATPQAGSTVEQLTGILAAQTARQGYTVQDDGTISIPSVGRVAIGGQSIEDAEATLFQRFLDRQLDPSFSLEIAEFNSKKVAIGGDVGAPSVVPVTLRPIFLDEALAAAGGARSADPDTALVRIYRDGKLYQIPLNDVYQSKTRVQLTGGDSVFVDSAYQIDQAASYFEEQIKLAGFKQAERQSQITALSSEVALRRGELDEAREAFQTRLEMGAERRDYVYLTGELAKQNRFALPFGQTASLSDALYDSQGGGGLVTAKSNPKQIYVLRGSQDPLEFNSITAWHLDARNAAALLVATRFELHANDVIFVASQPVSHWGNVVNAITPSLIVSTVNASTN